MRAPAAAGKPPLRLPEPRRLQTKVRIVPLPRIPLIRLSGGAVKSSLLFPPIGKSFRRFALLTFATFLLSWIPGDGVEPPPTPKWVKGSFIGSAFVLSFQPETVDWVGIEWTDDSVAWHELVNVAATSAATVYADLDARSLPYRAYRLRSPGTRAEDAARAWEALTWRDYQFHLDRISSAAPFLMQADVEIRDDAKLLTDVILDGFPVEEGDPEYFPAVGELFTRLEQARADGARQVWVTYDAALGFPARCTLDLRGLESGSVDGGALVQYRISNLRRR